MNFAEFSVRRPVATWMRLLIFMLLGAISLTQLPIELLPRVTPPFLYVVTRWPGVSPEDLESQITKPIEDAVATIPGLRSVSSDTNEGMSVVNVELQPGADLNQGALDVLQAVQSAQSSFPREDPTLQAPTIEKDDPAGIPVMVLGVSGIDDPVKLRSAVSDGVKPQLESAEGVASVQVDGGQERAIMIEFDPQVLLARSLTAQDLVGALTRENQNVPGGTVIDGSRQLLVRSYGWFQNLLDITAVPVGSANGRLIPLADVAYTYDRYKDVQGTCRLDGKPAVALSVKKQSTANTVTTVENCKRQLAEAQKLHPELTFHTVYDQSAFVLRAVNSLKEAAVLGGLLAMGVVFFFLRNVRSTLVVATSIPVSVISTFSLLYFMGWSLNTMSLVGLALAAGLIVDDAVVVLENIYRYLEEGLPPDQAAIQGARSIVGAVVSSTLTIMVVFLPILLVPGQTGQMFRQFALVVIVAMAFSLLDALTGVPMLCAQLVRHQEMKGLFATWTRWFEGLDRAYQSLLAGALRRRFLVLGTGASLTLVSLVLVPLIGFDFMPTADTGTVRIQLDMPVGTSLEQTDLAVQKLEKILGANPYVDTFLTFAGKQSSGSGGRDSATGWVALKERRPGANVINAGLMLDFKSIPGATAFPFTLDLVNLMVTGSMGEKLELDLLGNDLSQLSTLAHEVLARLRPLPGLADLRQKVPDPAPEVRWVIDRAKARQMGLTFEEIAGALQIASAGKTAGYYQERGSRSPIVVQLAKDKRRNLEELGHIIVNPRVASQAVNATSGTTQNAPRGVLLSQVAKPVVREGFPVITRRNRQRYLALVGTGGDRPVGEIQQRATQAMQSQPFPAGTRWAWGAKMVTQAREMRTLGFAVGMAIVLIYMLLAIQFESLIVPLSIMLSVPLCASGVVLALFLSGTPFSIMAGIGCLMLVGIAVKNGILLVENTIQARGRGVPREQALLEACPTRLRPILITALAAVLGMVPIALRGRGGELEAPMAIAVIGGLLASTCLTLFVVPLAYLLFDDLEARLKR